MLSRRKYAAAIPERGWRSLIDGFAESAVGAESFNAKLRELYNSYVELLESGNVEEALETGVKILEELLLLTKKNVIDNIANPIVKEVASEVLVQYEKELSFVKGAREAARTMPPLYAAVVADRALETLSNCINGLFNFAMGALIVIADLLSHSNL